MMKVIAGIVAVTLLVMLALWGLQVSDSLGGVEISIHGMIALGLGVLFSMLVGFGLMALVFRSNKSGHDAMVYQFVEEEDEDEVVAPEDAAATDTKRDPAD